MSNHNNSNISNISNSNNNNNNNNNYHSNSNSHFYLLNLNRRTDRYESFLNQMYDMHVPCSRIHRFTALEPHDLLDQELNMFDFTNNIRLQHENKRTQSCVKCNFLGHYYIWADIIYHQYQSPVIVCQDDVTFAPNFLNKLAVLESINNNDENNNDENNNININNKNKNNNNNDVVFLGYMIERGEIQLSFDKLVDRYMHTIINKQIGHLNPLTTTERTATTGTTGTTATTTGTGTTGTGTATTGTRRNRNEKKVSKINPCSLCYMLTYDGAKFLKEQADARIIQCETDWWMSETLHAANMYKGVRRALAVSNHSLGSDIFPHRVCSST